MKRVRSAVRRSRQSPDQLFKRFCKAGGTGVSGPIMTRSDFVRVLGTFEPHLEQEMVLRLWQHLLSQGSGEDGLNFVEFQRWFVNGEGVVTLSRTGSSSTSLGFSAMNGFDSQAHFAPYPDSLVDRPATAPNASGHSPILGRRSSRPPLSPTSASAAYFTDLGQGSMTLPIRSRSGSQQSLDVFAAGEIAPLRPYDEMHLIAPLVRIGRGLANESLTVAGAFVLYDEHLEKMLSLDKFLEATGARASARLTVRRSKPKFGACLRTLPVVEEPWMILAKSNMHLNCKSEWAFHRQSPHFADCPVAGAALRVLHVWAAASYHHALKPSVAFATESPELPFRPELRLILDTPWAALLHSQWSSVLFMGLSQMAAGLCPRVRRGLRPCAGKKEKGCDAEGAADLLPKKRTELDQIILAKAQGLIGGYLLRARGISKLFLQLASLAMPVEAAPRSLVDCDGRLQPVELNALAVRREVNPQLAAIALAASQRTCPRSLQLQGSRVNLVDLLIFMERLVPSEQVSGFFNEITENRCEMDVFSHFHKVYCVHRTLLIPAFMTSGLLIHPPYGPATWACYVPRRNTTTLTELHLLDPIRWSQPLNGLTIIDTWALSTG
eukprot:symbB.v1.2.011400.t1/scaffold764.1/size165801/6